MEIKDAQESSNPGGNEMAEIALEPYEIEGEYFKIAFEADRCLVFPRFVFTPVP